MTITVLSKSNCVQCDATKRNLDNADVDYEVGDIYSDENLNLVTELGYKAAPVVIIRDAEGSILDHWSGFNPTKITELASQTKAA